MDFAFHEKRAEEAAKHRGQGRTTAELQAAYHEFLKQHMDNCRQVTGSEPSGPTGAPSK